MAKDNEKIDDLELEDNDTLEDEGKEPIDSKEDKKDFKKMSLRETLNDAVKENEDKQEPDKKEKDSKGDKTDLSTDDDKELHSKEQEEIKKVSTQPKLKPPVSWAKESKAVWETLPPDIQKSVIKREEEFSNGIAQYSSKAKAYDELDSVIAKRREQIKQYGRSEAETVDTMFKWFENLANPDQNFKLNTFKALAQNFGVDISQFVPSKDQPVVDPNAQPDVATQVLDRLNKSLDQRFAPIDQRFQTYENQIKQREQQDAKTYVDNWAEKKPHFAKVKAEMFSLIQTGIVPLLPNGNIDLDAAYDRAVRANPETYEIFKEEEAEKARQEAIKKQAAEKARIAKARQAGSSLKTSAPTGNLNGSTIKAKNNGKAPTPGESIRAALAELRDTN